MGRKAAFIGGIIIPPHWATLPKRFFSSLNRVTGLAKRIVIFLLLGRSDGPAGFHQLFDMDALLVFT